MVKYVAHGVKEGDKEEDNIETLTFIIFAVRNDQRHGYAARGC